ncbi:Grip71 [Daphnia magna]|uniref:Grip71 n=1 Tax=Daphnia magna TaxID=35525 RepID=A0A165A7M0_9CRUS|nr:Grip71 [Daphnia magna]
MGPGKYCWVIAAETCQIWDENFETLHKFDDGNVLDVAWSHDGSILAYTKKNSKKICTASIGLQIYENNTTLLEGDATAVGFSNELLLAGTNMGNIFLWDYTKHKLIRKYDGVDRSAVCRIQSNNSVIACGHHGGVIQVYGIKTGQAMGQYSIKNSAGLRDLKISSVKNSLMAAAFNSGTVAAWNTVSSKGNNSLVVEFTGAHQSPASAVALSPVTDILMVSGGLDKNVILYDWPKKKILKKIEIDSPVTAIEFFPDGTSLVVGTNRGKVLVYDLRSISTPVQSMVAHTSPITKLICRACIQIPDKIESGIQTSNDNTKFPISCSGERLLPSSAKEGPEKPSRFPFLSPLPCELEPHTTLSFMPEVGNSGCSANFPAVGFENESKELEHKNSSLFSPLKGGDTSTDVFSSPSLATSPLLKFKGKIYNENHLPLHNQMVPTVTECETEISVRSTSVDFSIPKEDISNLQECKQTEEIIPNSSGSTDFQAEFIRRIVHDVEDNLREVLRCRFGDLIIQSAQQFLTLQNELEQLRRQIQDKAYLEEEVRQLREEVNQLRNLY